MSIDAIEQSLKAALVALEFNDLAEARFEIEASLQTLGDDLRNELGLYAWNRDGS